MKYIFALLILTVICHSQEIPSKEDQITAALLAAPPEFREAATVKGYDSQGTLITLQVGTNTMICLGDDPFAGWSRCGFGGTLVRCSRMAADLAGDPITPMAGEGLGLPAHRLRPGCVASRGNRLRVLAVRWVPARRATVPVCAGAPGTLAEWHDRRLVCVLPVAKPHA